MTKNKTFVLFENGPEDRIGEPLGPFEYVTVTYDTLRVPPDGEVIATYDGDIWVTEDGSNWTDYTVFAHEPEPAGVVIGTEQYRIRWGRINVQPQQPAARMCIAERRHRLLWWHVWWPICAWQYTEDACECYIQQDIQLRAPLPPTRRMG